MKVIAVLNRRRLRATMILRPSGKISMRSSTAASLQTQRVDRLRHSARRTGRADPRRHSTCRQRPDGQRSGVHLLADRLKIGGDAGGSTALILKAGSVDTEAMRKEQTIAPRFGRYSGRCGSRPRRASWGSQSRKPKLAAQTRAEKNVSNVGSKNGGFARPTSGRHPRRRRRRSPRWRWIAAPMRR